MSLYYEAADILKAPTNSGGSLKSRVFSNKNLKSPPAQIYALAIETCKWSSVLKEVIEKATLLSLERKLTPVLSLLLVHDLLLAKRGIALPATHGLRAAVERHKARLQAEFTKSRISRKLGSVEAFQEWIDSGEAETTKNVEPPHPRWIRINTLKAVLDNLLETIFKDYERVETIDAVRRRGLPRIYIDGNIPNLIAIPSCIDLSKNEAYKSGILIFQDKASCFPAYLLDPIPQDGDVMDTCAAPGNKTTHLAAILSSHTNEQDEINQTIHAFEKDKFRAQTLEKMINLAGSSGFTKVHANQDFLKVDPTAAMYSNVRALLLDPSCSGSGIVGRDEMPELHLPELKTASTASSSKTRGKGKTAAAKEQPKKDSLKRKREESAEPIELMVDDDGNTTAVATAQDLQDRLNALATFQLALLLHAFSFPAARKVTYSTCSIYFEENESVVLQALASKIAKERGWRILKRHDQIRGLREWPVRGDAGQCPGDEDIADACIRANKGDGRGTMGFFLAGFVRDGEDDSIAMEMKIMRDEHGHIIRDLMGIPIIAGSVGAANEDKVGAEDMSAEIEKRIMRDDRGHIIRDSMGIPILASTMDAFSGNKATEEDEEEWGGFDDALQPEGEESASPPRPQSPQATPWKDPSKPVKGKKKKKKKRKTMK